MEIQRAASSDGAFVLSGGEAVKLEPRSTQRNAIFVDLPGEIANLIFSFLPSASKACFALTCKHYYQQYKYILEEVEFRPPSQDLEWFFYYDQMICYDSRTELLLRLQGDSWRYCQGCRKLYRPAEFFWKKTRLRYFGVSCSVPGYESQLEELHGNREPLLAVECHKPHNQPLGHRRWRGRFNFIPDSFFDLPAFNSPVDETRKALLRNPSWYYHIEDRVIGHTGISVRLLRRGWGKCYIQTRYHLATWTMTQKPKKVSPLMICPHISLFEAFGESLETRQFSCESCNGKTKIQFRGQISNNEVEITCYRALDDVPFMVEHLLCLK